MFSFSNLKVSLTTELCTGIGNLKSTGYYWHVHSDYASTWKTENKDATCTQNGYTDRVICTECNSVIDWGTPVVAAGNHNFSVDENGFCDCEDCGTICNEVFEGKEYVDGFALNGWVGNFYYEDGVKLTGINKVAAADGEGEYYYDFGTDGVCIGKHTGLVYDENGTLLCLAGTPRDGWREYDGKYYYFQPETYYALANGVHKVGGHEYTFDETGVLTRGAWVVTEEGTRYIFAGIYALNEFIEVDGKTYWITNKSYVATGTQILQIALGEPGRIYVIDDEGVVEGVLDYML